MNVESCGMIESCRAAALTWTLPGLRTKLRSSIPSWKPSDKGTQTDLSDDDITCQDISINFDLCPSLFDIH